MNIKQQSQENDFSAICPWAVLQTGNRPSPGRLLVSQRGCRAEERLLRALDFRNKFSSRPYLPSRIIPPERKQLRVENTVSQYHYALHSSQSITVTLYVPRKILFSDILEVRWPDPATADLTRCIDNGNVKISSVDGYAHLYLSELQQEFTVEFLCKVSQSSAASLRSSQKNGNYQTGDQYGKSSKNSVAEMSSKQMRTENKKNEHGCAEECLAALQYYTSFLWRFIHGTTNITEIYPGDDSFFKSEGAFLGNYFVHYAIQKGTKKREEKMYSVKSLPPDVPGNPYSVSSVITQAAKILQYCYKTKLSLTHNCYLCCWKMVPETDGREMLPVLLYEKVIPSTGRLLVYSDHKVHAAFWDGVTLNMVWDFSSSCSKIQVNEDVGWCKLTTPDGVQQLMQISHPGIYERYIRMAIEWCRSLNERNEIAEYTGHSLTEENWSADAELEKIQRFNCIL
ncbi:PREDICTED: uncharacterized protein C5orf34 homolog [Nipponia nippon]|uniref:uncharacterized protein C5orf34 homolog n=1 Tax=Nipponia nippon TaxID=128390 RepID=UPI000510C8CD|nr:PREDICTED: uncharacterized protein C5orf34 homolog [Nipponia nippon]